MIYHRRPFTVTPGHGDDIYVVHNADGFPAAITIKEVAQRRLDGWNGLVEPTMERLLQDIDDMISPSKMDAGEAKDFLERLVTELDLRIASLKDEFRQYLSEGSGSV